jgi:uncharacterized protein
MLLDLNKLRGQREHVERILQPSALGPDDPDYRIASPVELSMEVSKAGADVFEAHGRVQTRLDLDCSRCLEAYEVPLDATFDLRYVPQSHAAGGGDDTGEHHGKHDKHDEHDEREIGDDDLTTAFYQDGLLDIGDLLREQFQLALPMKPLCSDACRGLCPECGANRNRIDCGCSRVWEDPRLAPLKSLLNRPKEN